MRVLVIDVGGTNVKMLVTGETEPRKFPSGARLTPRLMVAGVKRTTKDWKYDAIAIGYPAPVRNGKPINDPFNLGKGWVKFDFRKAFGKPVRIINDAAMQALGSYKGGRMLFLGLGTGLGTTLVVDGVIAPLELGHMPWRKQTFEDYVGQRGLDRYGKKRWRAFAAETIRILMAATEPDDVVIGGGNVRHLKTLPLGCRAGSNANAFKGGFRLWEKRPGSK